ncbi:hypothetical protein NQ318_008266 [Aromia moschata]|uniref:Uncharacterized protein n=1 Tax=Aromia moschata TaxID=1265417 RepID=A0AAV8XXK9_9CUCU|nr:hypothetical protein NQ318_008266 [Aromia moschata]
MKIEEFYSDRGTVEKLYGDVYGLTESAESILKEDVEIYHDCSLEEIKELFLISNLRLTRKNDELTLEVKDLVTHNWQDYLQT